MAGQSGFIELAWPLDEHAWYLPAGFPSRISRAATETSGVAELLDSELEDMDADNDNNEDQENAEDAEHGELEQAATRLFATHAIVPLDAVLEEVPCMTSMKQEGIV